MRCGIATSGDAAALAIMCQYWSEFHDWRLNRKAAPAVRLGMMAAATKHWNAIASKFGMTPSDRARLIAVGEDEADELEAKHVV